MVATGVQSVWAGIVARMSLAGVVGFAADQQTDTPTTSPGARESGTIEPLSNGGSENGAEKQPGLSADVPKSWYRDWSGNGTVAVVLNASMAQCNKSATQQRKKMPRSVCGDFARCSSFCSARVLISSFVFAW